MDVEAKDLGRDNPGPLTELKTLDKAKDLGRDNPGPLTELKTLDKG